MSGRLKNIERQLQVAPTGSPTNRPTWLHESVSQTAFRSWFSWRLYLVNIYLFLAVGIHLSVSLIMHIDEVRRVQRIKPACDQSDKLLLLWYSILLQHTERRSGLSKFLVNYQFRSRNELHLYTREPRDIDVLCELKCSFVFSQETNALVLMGMHWEIQYCSLGRMTPKFPSCQWDSDPLLNKLSHFCTTKRSWPTGRPPDRPTDRQTDGYVTRAVAIVDIYM